MPFKLSLKTVIDATNCVQAQTGQKPKELVNQLNDPIPNALSSSQSYEHSLEGLHEILINAMISTKNDESSQVNSLASRQNTFL
jgi:hypothetical protein